MLDRGSEKIVGRDLAPGPFNDGVGHREAGEVQAIADLGNDGAGDADPIGESLVREALGIHPFGELHAVNCAASARALSTDIVPHERATEEDFSGRFALMAQAEKRGRGRPVTGEPIYPPNHIAAWRTRFGLTQKELAKRSGVNRTSISKLEGARTGHTLGYILHLAVAMQIPPEQLLYRDPNDGDQWSAWVLKERIDRLPQDKRRLLSGMIDVMLAEAGADPANLDATGKE